MRSAPWFVGTILALAGCWSAKESTLFVENTPGGDVGGASGSSAGTASAGTAGVEAGGSVSGKGGEENRPPTGGGGATGNGGGGGTSGQPTQIPVITDCSMVEGASVSEINGHCYRVAFENLTFAGARDACHAAGGHLATVASQEENDFLRDLHDGEHWIGATDGRGDSTSGVGTYQWVTEEAWTFSEWEAGQPNAFATDCPDEDAEDDCFEHCAFQTDEGDWNDRSCWHTIVSICEWDVEPSGDGEAGAGAGGASGHPPE